MVHGVVVRVVALPGFRSYQYTSTLDNFTGAGFLTIAGALRS
jgi:hypothetical protein